MKLDLKSSNVPIVRDARFAVLAIAFWMLVLSPKREEAKKLGTEVAAKASLEPQAGSHRRPWKRARNSHELPAAGRARQGRAGRRRYGFTPRAAEPDCPASSVNFQNFTLEAGSGEAPPAPSAPEASDGASAARPRQRWLPRPCPWARRSAPRVSRSCLTPDFRRGLLPYRRLHQGPGLPGQDQDEQVSVDGRLLTINGFSLAPETESGFPGSRDLQRHDLSDAAEPRRHGRGDAAAPGESTATPAATTTGGTP